MIVPQNRLLWIFGCTVPPVALAAAVSPAAQGLAGITAALLLTLCAIDAFRMLNDLGGIQMDFPENLHLSRDRENTLKFSVRDLRGRIGKISLALELPPEVISVQRELPLSLNATDSPVEAQWPIVGLIRGEYRIEGCRFRIPSRLGLWRAQKRVVMNMRLRVYPDLTRSRKDMDGLLLTMNQAGRRAQRQIGQGRDFEKVRDYLPGDGMSDVHWRLTARRGHLVTKEFQLERTQDIYVIIDSSRLSCRPVAHTSAKGEERTEPIIERAIEAALTLGSLAVRQGDRFGIVSFAAEVGDFVRARSGISHFRMCRDTLLHLEPHGINPDFDELASFLVQNLRRRALLVIITSLDDPALAEAFSRSIDPVSRRHLVLVTMVKPNAVQPVFSGGKIADVAELYSALGGHLVWQGLRELEINLGRRGVGFSLVAHDQLCPEMISQYLKVKKRQIL
jgi:uncharacterized protein (DUF58 family)